MRISEYISPEYLYQFETGPSDSYKPTDTRRPRLTLKHLSKLRKVRELHRLEQKERDALIPTIYKTPDDPKKGKKKRH